MDSIKVYDESESLNQKFDILTQRLKIKVDIGSVCDFVSANRAVDSFYEFLSTKLTEKMSDKDKIGVTVWQTTSDVKVCIPFTVKSKLTAELLTNYFINASEMQGSLRFDDIFVIETKIARVH
jgi:hypothetical protein